MKAAGELAVRIARLPLAMDAVARRQARQAARRAKSEAKHAAWRAKEAAKVRAICKARGGTNVYAW